MDGEEKLPETLAGAHEQIRLLHRQLYKLRDSDTQLKSCKAEKEACLPQYAVVLGSLWSGPSPRNRHAMQKLVRCVERMKEKQRLSNRLSPWDLFDSPPSPRDPLRRTVVQCSETHHCWAPSGETRACASEDASETIHTARPERTPKDPATNADGAAATAIALGLHMTTEHMPTAGASQPCTILGSGTASSGRPDVGAESDATLPTLPYFDKQALFLHTTALRVWAEQTAATCAAAAVAAAWNMLCEQQGAARQRPRLSEGHAQASAEPSCMSESAAATTAINTAAPGSNQPGSQHGTQAISSAHACDSSLPEPVESPLQMQAEDVLQVYAAQQQHKV